MEMEDAAISVVAMDIMMMQHWEWGSKAVTMRIAATKEALVTKQVALALLMAWMTQVYLVRGLSLVVSRPI